ncbi:hypothetical protein ACFQY0_10070 [Haloferula chungangensis]|uniref:Uncharacterized protein n=1 Tax=Haloferula chungangensis TaxID=1048331 RepID=A0ABW2L5D1_9BACT
MNSHTADMSTPPGPERARPMKFGAASFRTGIYEFIPVPFFDDWLISRERRQIVRTILQRRGLGFDDHVVRILAGGGRSFSSRLRSFAKGLMMKPLRKIMRTALFWLTARRAAKNVVATYFLARYLHHPDLGAACEKDRITLSDARELAAVFEDISKNIDLKALGGAVRKVKGVLDGRRAFEVDRQELKDAIETEAPGFIAEFDALASAKLRESASLRGMV